MVRPPFENARSTSHEDARDEREELVYRATLKCQLKFKPGADIKSRPFRANGVSPMACHHASGSWTDAMVGILRYSSDSSPIVEELKLSSSANRSSCSSFCWGGSIKMTGLYHSQEV